MNFARAVRILEAKGLDSPEPLGRESVKPFMPASRAKGVVGLDAPNRVVRAARMMAHRLKCISWWKRVHRDYPGGVVSVAVATRILGVSSTRVEELIADGRLPVIDGMPGGIDRDRFIPLDALIGAPTPMETGRGIGWNMGREYTRKQWHGVNPWLETVENPPTEKKVSPE